MAITPLEMITMAPKSQEASQQRQTEVQRPVHEQIQLSDRLQQETRHNERQTVAAKETEYLEYRYDAKEKGNNGYSNQKNKNKKKDQDSGKNHAGPSCGFDVRI